MALATVIVLQSVTDSEQICLSCAPGSTEHTLPCRRQMVASHFSSMFLHPACSQWEWCMRVFWVLILSVSLRCIAVKEVIIITPKLWGLNGVEFQWSLNLSEVLTPPFINSSLQPTSPAGVVTPAEDKVSRFGVASYGSYHCTWLQKGNSSELHQHGEPHCTLFQFWKPLSQLWAWLESHVVTQENRLGFCHPGTNLSLLLIQSESCTHPLSCTTFLGIYLWFGSGPGTILN